MMRRPRRKTENELKSDCIVWNHEHPVGTPVIYHPIIGEKEGRPTKTKTEAFVLGGHTACVSCEREGMVCLEAVEVRKEADSE